MKKRPLGFLFRIPYCFETNSFARICFLIFPSMVIVIRAATLSSSFRLLDSTFRCNSFSWMLQAFQDISCDDDSIAGNGKKFFTLSRDLFSSDALSPGFSVIWSFIIALPPRFCVPCRLPRGWPQATNPSSTDSWALRAARCEYNVSTLWVSGAINAADNGYRCTQWTDTSSLADSYPLCLAVVMILRPPAETQLARWSSTRKYKWHRYGDIFEFCVRLDPPCSAAGKRFIDDSILTRRSGMIFPAVERQAG